MNRDELIRAETVRQVVAALRHLAVASHNAWYDGAADYVERRFNTPATARRTEANP